MEKITNKKVEITIRLDKVSKKFVNEWIFRGLELEASSANNYAVVGPNGSGKSTLIQCLLGLVPVSSGNITYEIAQQPISAEEIYQHISIASPATELIEEFTLFEFFNFHSQFKKLQFNTAANFAEAIFLDKHLTKQIKNFSSGMKQRLKLGLAFYSVGGIILFDEPTNNLDQDGCKWYSETCEILAKDKLIFVASNQKHEYEFCNRHINILDFK